MPVPFHRVNTNIACYDWFIESSDYFAEVIAVGYILLWGRKNANKVQRKMYNFGLEENKIKRHEGLF